MTHLKHTKVHRTKRNISKIEMFEHLNSNMQTAIADEFFKRYDDYPYYDDGSMTPEFKKFVREEAHFK